MHAVEQNHFTPNLPVKPMKNFYLDASHLELVLVSGADAERFLQSQLTCDVSSLADGTFIHGAACNNKGRVIAPFLLTRKAENFHLVFNKDLGSSFISALKKYLPFYKCSMELIRSEYHCLALSGVETLHAVLAEQIQPPAVGSVSQLQDGWLATLAGDGPLLLACLSDSVLKALPDPASIATISDDGSLWQAALMLSGHYPFSLEDSEKFTPQELMYDRKDYISFSKGCYPGQEIVARMHYRGKIKKQLYLVKITLPASQAIPEIHLLGDKGEELGSCTKLVRTDATTLYGLAVLPCEFGDTHRSAANSAALPLEIMPF